MAIRSRVARSAAITVALMLAAVASPTALAEPNTDTKLGIEFENGDYQPTIGNVDLTEPRYTNGSEAELVEEFDTRIGAVKSLSFSRGA